MLASLKDRLKANQTDATAPRSTVPASSPALAGFRDRMPFKDACRLPLAKIVPDPDQPRRTFPEESIERTARSLQSVGQLVPIIVRHDAARDQFVIIDGERRYRAAQRANLSELSAVVDSKANESTVLEIQLVVNALREDVNPMEQARAWERLAKIKGKSLKELSELLNYDATSIGRKISLLALPDQIQAAIEAKEISQETGIGLTQIDDPAEQVALAERARSGDLPRAELRERIAQSKAHAKRTRTPGETATGTQVKPGVKLTPTAGRAQGKKPTARTWKRPGGLRIEATRARGLDPLDLAEALRSALAEVEGEIAAA